MIRGQFGQISLVELAHPEQVRSCEPAEAGIATRELGRQLFDDAITPLGARDLSADMLAELSVQRHQLRIDGLLRATSRRLDERDHLLEACVMVEHRRGRGGASQLSHHR